MSLPCARWLRATVLLPRRSLRQARRRIELCAAASANGAAPGLSHSPRSRIRSSFRRSIFMDISIIIVGWNSKPYLEECLESLCVSPPSRSMEIIVVDNASTDGSVDMVAAKFPHVKLIKSEENLGFARANNVAIQESHGRYVGLVNPDVKVLPGCLDALADYLDQNPRVGNVGPRVLNSDMTLQSSCRRFPTLWN